MELPTLSMCDCPNGCVVLRFGYVTVHLPRSVFVAFARQITATASAIERGVGALPEH